MFLAIADIAPVFAASMAFEIGAILGITLAVVICTAIPLTTGVARGHVVLGIIGAIITLPAASFLGCLGGLPVAIMFAALISIMPVPRRPLLSQAEIEKEMQRARGY